MRNFFMSQYVWVGFNLIKVETLVTLQVLTYLEKTDLILGSAYQRWFCKLVLDKTERAELIEL